MKDNIDKAILGVANFLGSKLRSVGPLSASDSLCLQPFIALDQVSPGTEYQPDPSQAQNFMKSYATWWATFCPVGKVMISVRAV